MEPRPRWTLVRDITASGRGYPTEPRPPAAIAETLIGPSLNVLLHDGH